MYLFDSEEIRLRSGPPYVQRGWINREALLPQQMNGYIFVFAGNAGVAAQITPPPPPLKYTRVYSGLYPGIIWNIPWGIVCELPDYTPGYKLGAPRVYPTCSDYTPSDSGWGIVWEVGVYSERYYIYD